MENDAFIITMKAQEKKVGAFDFLVVVQMYISIERRFLLEKFVNM